LQYGDFRQRLFFDKKVIWLAENRQFLKTFFKILTIEWPAG
jgi:hypothetical protein